jgi:hypothetical protein
MAGAKHFPLEKILTVRAKDYCDSMDKNLAEYKMVGVHAQGYDIQAIAEIFGNQASGAEVIVDYQFMCHNVPVKADTPTIERRVVEQEIMIASGTALIPEKE